MTEMLSMGRKEEVEGSVKPGVDPRLKELPDLRLRSAASSISAVERLYLQGEEVDGVGEESNECSDEETDDRSCPGVQACRLEREGDGHVPLSCHGDYGERVEVDDEELEEVVELAVPRVCEERPLAYEHVLGKQGHNPV